MLLAIMATRAQENRVAVSSTQPTARRRCRRTSSVVGTPGPRISRTSSPSSISSPAPPPAPAAPGQSASLSWSKERVPRGGTGLGAGIGVRCTLGSFGSAPRKGGRCDPTCAAGGGSDTGIGGRGRECCPGRVRGASRGAGGGRVMGGTAGASGDGRGVTAGVRLSPPSPSSVPVPDTLVVRDVWDVWSVWSGWSSPLCQSIHGSLIVCTTPSLQ